MNMKLRHLSAKEIFSSTIILLPVFILLYALFNQAQAPVTPKADRGRIDLSSWDFEEKGPVALNGKWEFYWSRFSDSTGFPPAQTPVAYASVPGIWNNEKQNGHPLPAEGYATYALHVVLPDTGQVYMINVRTVSNAYRLRIDGKLVGTNGRAGTSAENSRPEYRPQTISFVPAQREVLISMEVSNFAHCKGGLWLPVEIGHTAGITRQRDTRMLLDVFLFGCLFIMALYHFGLYVLRRSDPAPLYFGLMCLVIGIRSLLTGENLIQHIVPGIDWFFARKTEYLLTFTSAPIFVSFSRCLFPQEWNKWFFRGIVYFGLALCLFVLVTPSRIFTMTSYVFTGYAWLASLYTIYVFIRAAINRKEGALIFMATSLLFLLTIVNDTLNQMEIIHTGLYLSFGLFVVTFAQSYIISSRFAKAFHTSEIYADTFRKFVPAQFLDKVAKDGIGSIRAGNAEKAEVTVMFSDIRSFTNLSESMTPDEVFRMLNEYLSCVEPPIRANNGFVDKYMGDGIMALFEDSPGCSSAEHAVQAAIAMQEALTVLNETRVARGESPLHTGIGLHTGSVIMGTLGGNERMDSTAIGDAVNMASRIEGMTKMYGARILVSDTTVFKMKDRSQFLLRFTDKVVAKGKTEPIGIWEVSGKRSDPKLQTLLALLPEYEKAIDAFYTQKDFARALEHFSRCLEMLPGDTASNHHCERCREAIRTGRDPEENTWLQEK